VALVTAKSEPLVEKAIHFPSVFEFRHATSKPFVHFSGALATTVTYQFGCADIVVYANPRIGFK
jgi:hypothetical protein